MKSKYMIICTPQGRYRIPLQKVAEHRADYYAVVVDGNDRDSDSYHSEVRSAMNDDFTCIDWIHNNSDWSDWKGQAEKIDDMDFAEEGEDFWSSSENFEVVMMEDV